MLTHEQLAESCTRNGLSAYVCGQDYWATLEDAKDNDVEEDQRKYWVMEQMLLEELDFGQYNESDDEDSDDWHSERMAIRYDILDKVVDEWVSGMYSGKEASELELAQRAVNEVLRKLDE